MRRPWVRGTVPAVKRFRTARDVRPGGWIDMPGRGTGRVTSVWWAPGTTFVHVTLEGGGAFSIRLWEAVRYWDN